MARNATIEMIAAHAGKKPVTVRRVLRKVIGKDAMKKVPGVRGFLIPLSTVNKFLRENWPAVGEMAETTEGGK